LPKTTRSFANEDGSPLALAVLVQPLDENLEVEPDGGAVAVVVAVVV
jgi:hypothetical protein